MLIKLTVLSAGAEYPMWVNAAMICTLVPTAAAVGMSTTIAFDSLHGPTLQVRETPEQIMDLVYLPEEEDPPTPSVSPPSKPVTKGA